MNLIALLSLILFSGVIGGVLAKKMGAPIILGRLIFPLLGFSDYEALFLGAVFSLSSTAVVVKILEEIGQLETHASEITIGWLILQDIAVFFIIFAFISESLGISFTLGAFLAGIMISDSFLHYEIFSEVKPLKTIFSLLFFLS